MLGMKYAIPEMRKRGVWTIFNNSSIHGIVGVDVMSAYRTKPRPSFHTLGLGLDLLRFWTPQGVLSVFDDFEETPHHETCAAPPARTAAGRHQPFRQLAGLTVRGANRL